MTNASAAGECYSKMLSAISTLQHSSYDHSHLHPASCFVCGGMLQQNAVCYFHPSAFGIRLGRTGPAQHRGPGRRFGTTCRTFSSVSSIWLKSSHQKKYITNPRYGHAVPEGDPLPRCSRSVPCARRSAHSELSPAQKWRFKAVVDKEDWTPVASQNLIHNPAQLQLQRKWKLYYLF